MIFFCIYRTILFGQKPSFHTVKKNFLGQQTNAQMDIATYGLKCKRIQLVGLLNSAGFFCTFTFFALRFNPFTPAPKKWHFTLSKFSWICLESISVEFEFWKRSLWFLNLIPSRSLFQISNFNFAKKTESSLHRRWLICSRSAKSTEKR